MNEMRIYGHQEIAMLFFPDIQPKSASAQLRKWITRDDELMGELKVTGYRKGQRVYSPLQATIIFDHLGVPETLTLK